MGSQRRQYPRQPMWVKTASQETSPTLRPTPAVATGSFSSTGRYIARRLLDQGGAVGALRAGAPNIDHGWAAVSLAGRPVQLINIESWVLAELAAGKGE